MEKRKKMEKLCVDKTYSGTCLYFREKDVRKACELNGCPPNLIEKCIQEMKEGISTCSCCFITLVNDLNITPEEEV